MHHENAEVKLSHSSPNNCTSRKNFCGMPLPIHDLDMSQLYQKVRLSLGILL